jgi:hypothetical protein
MGEGLTDYQTKQLLERMRGIERRLKDICDTLDRHFERMERMKQPEPPADPMGYTE